MHETPQVEVSAAYMPSIHYALSFRRAVRNFRAIPEAPNEPERIHRFQAR